MRALSLFWGSTIAFVDRWFCWFLPVVAGFPERLVICQGGLWGKIFSKDLREWYMSDPTMLVPPGPVLFLPGWQLLLPEYCKLNLGLRFGDCTGIPCLSEDRFFFSVFLQTERVSVWGVGGMSSWSTSKGTDYCVFLCSICPSLRFYLSAVLAGVGWKDPHAPFRCFQPLALSPVPADVALWEPKPASTV